MAALWNKAVTTTLHVPIEIHTGFPLLSHTPRSNWRHTPLSICILSLSRSEK